MMPTGGSSNDNECLICIPGGFLDFYVLLFKSLHNQKCPKKLNIVQIFLLISNGICCNNLKILSNFLFTFAVGQRLCLAEDKYIGGTGTYSRQGYIMSCLAGVVKVTAQPDKVILTRTKIYKYYPNFCDVDHFFSEY